ncbi:MAG: LysR family transcriptional regulator [Bacillota bacterium]
MIDRRLETFLNVCEYKNYTKAAEKLNFTQPAVTQHIQYLENIYGAKLFVYKNKKLLLTKAGELLFQYAKNAYANEKLIRGKIQALPNKRMPLQFAATLTIGEYTIAPVLKEFINRFNRFDVTLYVDNTEEILHLLEKGKISFALVEGLFDKDRYYTKLLKLTDFILIVSVDHPLRKKDKVTVYDLQQETLIIREKGSGSREVLEKGLYDINYTLNGFNSIIEIGNVSLIKRLVRDGLGISFIYKDAVKLDIERGRLATLTVSDFNIQREFNLIANQDSIVRQEIKPFEEFFLSKLS